MQRSMPLHPAIPLSPSPGHPGSPSRLPPPAILSRFGSRRPAMDTHPLEVVLVVEAMVAVEVTQRAVVDMVVVVVVS